MTMEEELTAILNMMDIPHNRREINPENLAWLQRNLHMRNRLHSKFAEADRLVRILTKTKRMENL